MQENGVALVELDDDNIQVVANDLPLELGYILAQQISTKRNIPITAMRRTMKGILGVVSLPAGIPFIGMARQFANSNEVYGYFLAGGAVACYSNVCLWSYMGLTDEIFSQTKELNTLLDRSLPNRAVRWSTPILFGCITSIPSAYVSYTYNNDNLIWPAVNFISAYGYRVYGFYRGIELLSSYFRWRHRNNPSDQFAKKLIGACHTASRSITQLKKLKISELITQDEVFGPVINVNELIKRILDANLDPSLNLSQKQFNIQYYGKFIGCILPIAQISLNAMLAFNAYDLVSSNVIFKTTMTGLTMFPDASLTLTSAVLMASSLFDIAFSMYNRSDIGRNVFYYNLKLALLFYAATLLISSFSYGAYGFAIEDTFSESISAALLPIFIIADTLFHTYILSNNSARFIEVITAAGCDTEKKEILTESKMIDRFANIVERLPSDKAEQLYASYQHHRLYTSQQVSNTESSKNQIQGQTTSVKTLN